MKYCNGDILNSGSGAVILAGGDSKRLGSPKALLKIGGMTLIEQMIWRLQPIFDELFVVTDRQDLYRHLPVKLVSDLITNTEKSPLRGIHAGLSSTDLPWLFFVACDMPNLNPNLIEAICRYAPFYDAVVPAIGSYYQPLHACYSKNCIRAIETTLKAGQFKVTAFYDNLNVKFIDECEIKKHDPGLSAFTNVNTWDDYEKLLRPLPEAGEEAL